VTVPGRAGPIRARLYRTAGSVPGPGLVIAHGVSYRGIDEPRLVPFAREIARTGRVVLTPELADLTDYRITGSSVGVITDSIRWLSARPEVSRPKVGLLGLSFAGGLSLVVAEDPEAARYLEYVTSVGGHDDLERVLRFLVSDEPSETEWAELELTGQPHLCLVSPLVRHVEVTENASLRDEVALVDFVARIL